MNIMAINFDWLLTIPGLLITSGVILLLIALTIFIVTTVKSKKEAKEDKGGNEENASVSTIPDMTVSENKTEETDSTVFPTITDTPLSSTVDTQGASMNLQNTVTVVPLPEEEVETQTEPEIEIPAVSETKEEDEKTTIYGGVTPTAPVIEEVHRPIYGGADPLDATKMDTITEPTPVAPVVNSIVEEATLTDVVPEIVEEKQNAAVVDTTTSDFIVEPIVPDVVTEEEKVDQKEETPIPVETEEKIEEL